IALAENTRSNMSVQWRGDECSPPPRLRSSVPAEQPWNMYFPRSVPSLHRAGGGLAAAGTPGTDFYYIPPGPDEELVGGDGPGPRSGIVGVSPSNGSHLSHWRAWRTGRGVGPEHGYGAVVFQVFRPVCSLRSLAKPSEIKARLFRAGEVDQHRALAVAGEVG